jgi:biotin carboxylase
VPKLTRKDHVAIVDAYSGGRYLIPAFQALGYPVVHVESAPPPAVFRADSERARRLAEQTLRFDGDVDDLVDQLRRRPARVVVTGSEGGVLLADRLAAVLDLPFRNSLEFSPARRDKFAMQERLRAAGLAHATSALVTDAVELTDWLDRHGRFPVVVKPVQSAGTDGVSVCGSAPEALAALDRIRSAPDLFGNPNAAAVCQEYLVGDEHVLNGVARDGRYWFSEGWRSTKASNHGFRVYQTQYLTYAGDAAFDRISPYVVEVCRALGIVNGAFHAEVMLTARGPVLIEVAARVAGGADPYVIENCLGHSQVDGLVTAALHPDRFAAMAAAAPAAPLRHAAYVYLIAEYAGQVERVDLDDFLQVPGVVSVDYHYAAGEHQPVTRDLLTAAGVVMVTADTPAELDLAVDRIREIERAMYARSVSPVPAR